MNYKTAKILKRSIEWAPVAAMYVVLLGFFVQVVIDTNGVALLVVGVVGVLCLVGWGISVLYDKASKTVKEVEEDE